MVAVRALTHASGIALRDVACGPVAGVTLAIPPGQVCALLGRNGAGKSTLLRALAGLIAVDGGELSVPAPIGYAPQDYRASLFPWLSVLDNIALLARGEGRRDRARAAAAAVGVPEALLDRRPARLSGGEQQLCSLARALAAAPRALLLDEPFSALDIAARARARRAVVDWARQTGAATVLVTHDLDDALDAADRAIVVAREGGACTAPGRVPGAGRGEAAPGREPGAARGEAAPGREPGAARGAGASEERSAQREHRTGPRGRSTASEERSAQREHRTGPRGRSTASEERSAEREHRTGPHAQWIAADLDLSGTPASALRAALRRSAS